MDRWRLFAVVAPLCVYSTNQNTWLDQRVTIVTLKPCSSVERYDKSVFSRAEIFFFFFFIIPIINSYLRCVPLIYFRRIFISESNTGNQRFHRGRNVYEIFNVYVTSLKITSVERNKINSDAINRYFSRTIPFFPPFSIPVTNFSSPSYFYFIAELNNQPWIFARKMVECLANLLTLIISSKINNIPFVRRKKTVGVFVLTNSPSYFYFE